MRRRVGGVAVVTLVEALAAEAVAYMWCVARADNLAFDEARLGLSANPAGFDALPEAAREVYWFAEEALAEAEREWQWSVETVAGALVDECGEVAAELLWHLVQDRVDDPGLEGPTVAEAVMITQAVLTPQRAYDRLPGVAAAWAA